jgi:hypothetical protein
VRTEIVCDPTADFRGIGNGARRPSPDRLAPPAGATYIRRMFEIIRADLIAATDKLAHLRRFL